MSRAPSPGSIGPSDPVRGRVVLESSLLSIQPAAQLIDTRECSSALFNNSRLLFRRLFLREVSFPSLPRSLASFDLVRQSLSPTLLYLSATTRSFKLAMEDHGPTSSAAQQLFKEMGALFGPLSLDTHLDAPVEPSRPSTSKRNSMAELINSHELGSTSNDAVEVRQNLFIDCRS